jgi:uracil-DNA glycosylase family 4
MEKYQISEPEWRLKLRKCRKCLELAEPLAFIGEEGIARPLFHEEGDLESEILFVLEAPNYGDTFDPQKGRMTFGEASDPTGRFFGECLRDEVGIGLEQTMVVNSVLCLPARRVDGKHPVRTKQIRLCSPNLASIIENVDPTVVVTLGGRALEALELIEPHRLALRDAVARPHGWFGRALFPLYHPSSLGRVTRSTDEQRADYNALRSFIEEHRLKTPSRSS